MNILERFSLYLTSQNKRMKNATIRNYIADIAQFIGWCENTKKKPFAPQEITLQHMRRYTASRRVSSSSIKRYLSSLRMFFRFLTSEGIIAVNPFPQESAEDNPETQGMRDFANYLYVFNASPLTIKYYLLDVKHFLSWANAHDPHSLQATRSETLIQPLIERYKRYLTTQCQYAHASINRKLAAGKKYLLWQLMEK